MRRHITFMLVAMLSVILLFGCSGTTGNNHVVSVEQAESISAPPYTPTTSPDINTLTPNTSSISAGPSTVYMTTDISSEGLMAIYDALEFEATGNVVVKLSTGEPPNSNYLRLELSMAEAGKAVSDSLNGKIVYVNVMNRISIDCDCNGNPAKPDMHDVGILASIDPVALDKACIDIVAADPYGASLMNRINSQNGTHTLDYAAEIGLGSLEYSLVSIED